MGPKKWAMWAEACIIQTMIASDSPSCGSEWLLRGKIINCDIGHGPKEVGDVGGEMRNSDKTSMRRSRQCKPPRVWDWSSC